MIHKTVHRLSAFISRNASCWHCCTVITPAAQRKQAGDRGLLWILPKIYIHLHTEQLWCAGRGEPSHSSKAFLGEEMGGRTQVWALLFLYCTLQSEE